MKKVFLTMLVFSLVFAFGGITIAQELEKIPSPDQIKYFKVVKKEGQALFGIRLQKPKQEMSSEATTSSLEKILTPSDMGLFEKIRKIGKSLFGVRKIKEHKLVYITPSAAQCVKDAISKKDTALKAATDNHSQSIVSAIDARSACQQLAIDKTTAKEQFDANKICIKTFQESTKNVNSTMEKLKNDARKIYQTDLKACSKLQTPTVSSTITVSSIEEIIIDDGENGEDQAQSQQKE